MIALFFFIMSTYIGSLQGCCKGINSDQIKSGNLALANSLQPGPLFGFGQNVVEKGNFQLFTIVDYLHGSLMNSPAKYNDVSPALLYSFNDHSSIYIAAPCAVQSTFDGRLNGIESLLVQFELDLYVNNYDRATDEITFLVAGLLPVGSPFMNPPTGYSAPSVFIGTTASHLAFDWYYFAEIGGIMNLPRNNIKYGDVLLYNLGLGKNIAAQTDRYIVSWLLELNGLYDGYDTYGFSSNPDSGGHYIFLGPSLWVSTQQLIIQAGIELGIYNKINGLQPLRNYFASMTVGWKFN